MKPKENLKSGSVRSHILTAVLAVLFGPDIIIQLEPFIKILLQNI